MAILSSIICFAMAGIEVYARDGTNVNVVMETLLPLLATGKNIDNLILNEIGIRPSLALAFYVLVRRCA
jgi:hypothetical protein